MLSLTRHSVRVFQRIIARNYTFEALARDHHVLANKLQKISEMDRKFVSYEVRMLICSSDFSPRFGTRKSPFQTLRKCMVRCFVYQDNI